MNNSNLFKYFFAMSEFFPNFAFNLNDRVINHKQTP